MLANISALGQTQVCSNINNVWGDWNTLYDATITGRFSDLMFCQNYTHTSDYYFRVTITNFSIPDKKTKRAHIKQDIWYTYSGYVEYAPYISKFDGSKMIYEPSNSPEGKLNALKYFYKAPDDDIIFNINRYRRRVKATIKIAPYKNTPEVYNVWFEGFGIGIQL